jgi:CRISPR-associated protein Cmr2
VDCYIDTIEHLKQVDGPQDLENIAEASDPPGFITFIYADGNNMGGYLENVKTPAQYRQFSERAFIATQKAAFEALAEHLSPTDQNLHPFEIVSIGGDDLLLIVPGSKAFEVVHAIGENFDREFDSHSKFAETAADKLRKSQRYTPSNWATEQTMQPAISLSLGFVIANEHTPIGFLEHLAASLLKSAKSRAKTLKKKEVGYLGGTVDFLVLKSLSMITSELGDFRKQFYKTNEDNVLTMRPFTLHELHGFIKTVKKFKESDFPRSQLYQLRQSLGLGRHTSTLDYLYFRSRLRDSKGKLLQQEIESNWQGVPDIMNGLGPWYATLKENETDKKRYETLILDLIEAYEFISESNDSNEESQQ